nr:uncharacterized protein LOC123773404 [Procambarus clarkii]
MQGSGGGRTCTVFSTITIALPAAQTSSLYVLYVSLDKVDYVNSLVPSSYNSLLNNKDTQLTACPAGTAIGALILDNGDSRQTKANYAECRQLIYAPGFALQSAYTNVTTGLMGQMSSQAQQCETDAVMVGLTGYDDKMRINNWQEPYYATGQCQRLVGWKVDYGQCVKVTSPSSMLWTGQSYPSQSSSSWNMYFLCPNKYLVVELSRKWLMSDNKPQYYSVLCCLVIPAL